LKARHTPAVERRTRGSERRPDHDIARQITGRGTIVPVNSRDDREQKPALELDDDGEAVGIRVLDVRQPGQAFARARLTDVELVRCDLSGCDFSESTWRRVRLIDCRTSAVDLSQTDLRDVTFRDCKLDDANLRLARLKRVRFDGSALAAAEFTGGTLDDVGFDRADLTRVDFTHARCAAVDLRGARLDGLRGIAALAGAVIGTDQLFGLAAGLAHAVGLRVEDEE
jgi:uncharacterized protein YjbI with pentapeptide repeats